MGGYAPEYVEIMTEQCSLAKLPPPTITNDGSDFLIVFRKDIYNKEDLSKLGLNDRQLDALLFFKMKGEITTSEYMKKYGVSERTARYDLSNLVDRGLVIKDGEKKSARYLWFL